MSDKTHELLPFNAPTVMRDVLKSLNYDSTLDPGIDSVRDIKWPTPPEAFLPWLLQERGLSPFVRIRGDDRALYTEGIELNRVKGTKKAVRIVSKWFGFENIVIHTLGKQGVHFPEFFIEIDRLPDKPEDLCDFLDAINRVKPLRSRFRRVIHGYFRPMFIPSHSPWGDLLSDCSGIHSTDIGLCSTNPSLCKQDLRISFRIYDKEGVEPTSEVGDNDRTVVVDLEHVRHVTPFPVPSHDFNGHWHPAGGGSVGEFQTDPDVEGFGHDANRAWCNFDWCNDSWTDNDFAFIGENDVATEVIPPMNVNSILLGDNEFLADENGNPIIYA